MASPLRVAICPASADLCPACGATARSVVSACWFPSAAPCDALGLATDEHAKVGSFACDRCAERPYKTLLLLVCESILKHPDLGTPLWYPGHPLGETRGRGRAGRGAAGRRGLAE